jgi:hypothetical protein
MKLRVLDPTELTCKGDCPATLVPLSDCLIGEKAGTFGNLVILRPVDEYPSQEQVNHEILSLLRRILCLINRKL